MRELQDNNNYIVEKVVLMVMVMVTIATIIITIATIIITIITSLINYQSIAETRMGNQCAMPAVSITSCIM